MAETHDKSNCPGPPVVHLTLTRKQREALAPLDELVEQAAAAGRPGMVVAQIIGGKLRAGWMPSHMAAKVIGDLGGDPGSWVSSVEECGDRNVLNGG